MDANEIGIYQSPPKDIKEVPCKSCKLPIHPEKATWYNVGISHYNKSKGVSYIQDHSLTYSCDEECARNHIHLRIDTHKELEHGVFSDRLNPDNNHPDELVRVNAEYTPLTRTWESLPTINALTGERLADDIYVPHLDRWSHHGGIQGGYHQFTGELATSTLEQCIELCHLLVDKVLNVENNPNTM